jgi:glycosyltransferase involved in cell wall biosynthesis
MKKIKLGICCNFSHKHVGGSEIVIKNISEKLVKNYNYEVNVYSFSCDKVFSENGVKYAPCKKGDAFVSQIASNSHIMVYSDSFWCFDTLLGNMDKIDCRLSLALVGAYHMKSHPESFELFKKYKDRFDLITHAKGVDYKWCEDNRLDVKIIPNGVNLSEFRENNINFREKYNIKEEYVFLNVSSYFYGKGQEALPKIYEKLKNIYNDFVILSISNTIKYPYDKLFLDRTKKRSRGMNIKFLRDIPREDVVAAFKCSDVFCFTSRKEVAPLVILESRAAQIPWISLEVGDVMYQTGGIIINIATEDIKGYKIFDERVVNQYKDGLWHILNTSWRNDLILREKENIEEIDWKNIIPLYDNLLRK